MTGTHHDMKNYDMGIMTWEIMNGKGRRKKHVAQSEMHIYWIIGIIIQVLSNCSSLTWALLMRHLKWNKNYRIDPSISKLESFIVPFGHRVGRMYIFELCIS